jgi:hypothetical protein
MKISLHGGDRQEAARSQFVVRITALLLHQAKDAQAPGLRIKRRHRTDV